MKREYQCSSGHWRSNKKQIKQKTLGSDHPLIAADSAYLGKWYKNKGQYNEAEKYFRQALRIDKKTSGTKNLNMGYDYLNLSETLLKQGKVVEGEFMIHMAFRIYEHALVNGNVLSKDEHEKISEFLEIFKRVN